MYSTDIQIIKFFMMPMAAIAMMILGILICTKKKKNGIFLGLWLITASVAEIVSFAQMFMMKSSIPMGEVSRIVVMTNAVISLLTILELLLLILHAKVLYGSKGLVPVLILAISGEIVPRILSALVLRVKTGETAAAAMSCISSMICNMFYAACLVIIMVAYIRGRYKDELSITRFRLPLFLLVLTVITIGIYSITAAVAIEGKIVYTTTEAFFFSWLCCVQYSMWLPVSLFLQRDREEKVRQLLRLYLKEI